MKEYFLTVIVVAIIGGIVISLEGGKGSGRYIRLLCGVCTAGCIVLPIASLIADGWSADEGILELFEQEQFLENYDEYYNYALDNAENINADNILKSNIIQALSLDDSDIDVHIVVGNNGGEKYIDIVEVTIYAQGLDIDPRLVQKYVKELLGCQCVIYYDV